jgi:transcriptional regulator with XRE-family HTH domain
MAGGRRTLGAVITGLRTRNGWTLKEMSERCGIPVSTLSKVEHDRLSLAYDKLQQLAERLNIRIADLFAEAEGAAATIMGRRSLGTLDRALRVDTPNYEYYYLCPELRQKRMVPVISRVRAHSLSKFGELLRHSGEEFIFVTEGAITVHTEFYEPVELKAGESIYIDSGMGHAYLCAPGHKEAMIVSVMSSAEEDLSQLIHETHGEAVAEDAKKKREPRKS